MSDRHANYVVYDTIYLPTYTMMSMLCNRNALHMLV